MASKVYGVGMRRLAIHHPETAADNPLTGHEEFIVAQAAEIDRLRESITANDNAHYHKDKEIRRLRDIVEKWRQLNPFLADAVVAEVDAAMAGVGGQGKPDA